jgi:hypothetical protein
MTEEQLGRLADALANVETAIATYPTMMTEGDPRSHRVIVGDSVRLALALKGFVVADDPDAAAEVVRAAGVHDERN